MLQIKLDDEALKTDKIEEISDIKDIDFTLRISEDFNDLAEVPIKITF